MKNQHPYLLYAFFCASVSCSIFAQSATDSLHIKDSSAIDEAKETASDNLPVISLDENDFKESVSQNISSLLNAGRDPFLTAISFSFSIARFRLRGYDGDMHGTYINGIPMDNPDNGFTPFNLWSGLNDVMRNRDVSLGLSYNTFSFGDIGTSTNIDARAAKQHKQTSLGYAFSNRTYTHRISLTHHTGLTKNGWAFSFSGSRRYAGEAYVPGTYYNSWSYYAGVDKKIGTENLLSLIAFGTPTENGRQGASVMEIQELAGTHYYNPYWGYQNGKKRNASVNKTFQPAFIFTHEYHISNKTILTTAVAFVTGNKITTGLDWYNAPDPRPDYYRYLPSYYADDSTQYLQMRQLMKGDENARQINWQHLYDVNRNSNETIHNANGIEGNDLTGKRSRYILEERIVNTQRMFFNTTINSNIGEHLQVTGGMSYQVQKNHYYKKVKDLLGGEFYVNLNQFAERDFPNNNNAVQNDLNHPNRILKTGDQFGYDYAIHVAKAEEWIQLAFRFSRVDFFVAGNASYTKFYRYGNVRNGLFPQHSYGKSADYQFFNTGIKAGITYKLNGRHYLFVNGAYLTRAPYLDNVYISPRTRDFTQDNITSELIQTVEGGYALNAPKIKIRLRGYYTRLNNGLNVLSFYHDDYRSFVNYATRKIDKLYYGGEFGAELTPLKNITLTLAAAAGRYYYNSRQTATVSLDNSTEVLEKATIYANNFRVAGTPQQAYNCGIAYRSPKNWFISITGNYFDETWLDFNPLRRTATAVNGLDKGELFHQITDQTKLDAQYTVDFFAGIQLKMFNYFGTHKRVTLILNAGLSNLLDNKNLVTGGYEQLRFNSAEKDISKFPPKLFYAFGRTYFLSASLRF